MDRREALKTMGMAIAAAALAGVAPNSYAAILKDRATGKKRLVFYFTATGNSLFVAKSLADAPLSIPQELKKGNLTYEADEIGFVFPDYAAAAPLIVREFLKKAQLKAQYMFSVITFGNASVNVAEWWDNYAKEHGVSFNYIKPIMMVDNYLPVSTTVRRRRSRSSHSGPVLLASATPRPATAIPTCCLTTSSSRIGNKQHEETIYNATDATVPHAQLHRSHRHLPGRRLHHAVHRLHLRRRRLDQRCHPFLESAAFRQHPHQPDTHLRRLKAEKYLLPQRQPQRYFTERHLHRGWA